MHQAKHKQTDVMDTKTRPIFMLPSRDPPQT